MDDGFVYYVREANSGSGYTELASAGRDGGVAPALIAHLSFNTRIRTSSPASSTTRTSSCALAGLAVDGDLAYTLRIGDPGGLVRVDLVTLDSEVTSRRSPG
jgi:hypothetical protein